MTLEKITRILRKAKQDKNYIIPTSTMVEIMAAHVDAPQRAKWRFIFAEQFKMLKIGGVHFDKYFTVEKVNNTGVKLVRYEGLFNHSK